MNWNRELQRPTTCLQVQGADVGMDASDFRCLRDLEVNVILKIWVDEYYLRFPADCTFEFIFNLAWLVAAQPITTLKGCDNFRRSQICLRMTSVST